MRMVTIDSIVRGSLMTMQKPIHFYVQALHYALNGLRDINIHTFSAVQSAELTVDNFNSATLPGDFTDVIKVGWKKDRIIVPLGATDKYNRKPNLDGTTEIPYQNQNVDVRFASNFTVDEWAVYTGYYGESLGGNYGSGLGDRTDVYQIVPERNKILVGPSIRPGEIIYMEYISLSDFATADAMVHAYCADAINYFILYQFSMHDRVKRLGDQELMRREYYNAVRKMRASLNRLTKEDIIRLTRDNVSLSIKA